MYHNYVTNSIGSYNITLCWSDNRGSNPAPTTWGHLRSRVTVGSSHGYQRFMRCRNSSASGGFVLLVPSDRAVICSAKPLRNYLLADCIERYLNNLILLSLYNCDTFRVRLSTALWSNVNSAFPTHFECYSVLDFLWADKLHITVFIVMDLYLQNTCNLYSTTRLRECQRPLWSPFTIPENEWI